MFYAIHWGYTENDTNYKSVSELIDDLVDSRRNGCNLLMNVGLKRNGLIRPIEKEMLSFMGKWIKENKDFVYDVFPTDITSENTYTATDGKYHYVITRSTGMSAEPYSATAQKAKRIVLDNAVIESGIWLDNGEDIVMTSENSFLEMPFRYGTSLASHRVARIVLKHKI